MGVMKVLRYPDPFLKEIAELVESDEIETLQETIDAMIETMYAEGGVGLAATQVGVKKRIFIMDVAETQGSPVVLINPEIIDRQGQVIDQEGCLSFPNVVANVQRSEWIKVRALDRHGQVFEKEGSDLFARCVQHELDHLNGVTFFDHLSRLKRQRIEKKYYKMAQEAH